MTLRDKIKAACDHRWEPVPTPEWPEVEGQVFVRTMSALERAEIGRKVGSFSDSDPAYKVWVEFTIAACCDDRGELLFTSADEDWLATKSPAALRRIYDKVLSINGIGQAAAEEAKGN